MGEQDTNEVREMEWPRILGQEHVHNFNLKIIGKHSGYVFEAWNDMKYKVGRMMGKLLKRPQPEIMICWSK